MKFIANTLHVAKFLDRKIKFNEAINDTSFALELLKFKEDEEGCITSSDVIKKIANDGNNNNNQQRTVLCDFLVVQPIEQIDVLFRPVGADVHVLFITQSAPLPIVSKGEYLHQGKNVGRLLSKFPGGEILTLSLIHI